MMYHFRMFLGVEVWKWCKAWSRGHNEYHPHHHSVKLIIDQANSRRQEKSDFPWGPAVTDGEPRMPVSAQPSPNPRPSPWHHRRSGPAQMRCETRLPNSHKGAQSEVTNSTLQLRAAWDEYIRNAEVSLCHRCAFVPVNPLGCFWIYSDYISNTPKCLCYCLSAQCFVEHAFLVTFHLLLQTSS